MDPEIHHTDIEDEEVETPAIVYLPGERFFVKYVQLPEELERKELEGYLELLLEEASPFPVDQMRWGYLNDFKGGRVLLYAIYADRIDGEFREQVEEAEHVYPSFFPGALGEVDAERVYLHGNTLSRIEYDTRGVVPIRLVNQHIGDEYEPEPGTWVFQSSSINENGVVEFVNMQLGTELLERVQLYPSKDRLWEGDIREKDVLDEKRKMVKVGGWLWKFFMGIGVAAGLFVMGEVGMFMGKMHVKGRLADVVSEEAHISEIETQDDLVSKIEEITDDYYTPFKVLEIVNSVRPEKVHFTSAVIGNVNDFEFEGEGVDVAEVNGFVDQLRESSQVKALDLKDIVTRQGKVRFKIALELNIVSGEASS